MSRTRKYTPESLEVMQRFFKALDKCIELGLIKNQMQFCTVYKIDRRHLYHQRKDLNKGLFQVSWLLPLINDCRVSPRWILTGYGSMFSSSYRHTSKAPKNPPHKNIRGSEYFTPDSTDSTDSLESPE